MTELQNAGRTRQIQYSPHIFKAGYKLSETCNTIRIFNGYEVLIENSEGNCSASRGLPSDAEQLPE